MEPQFPASSSASYAPLSHCRSVTLKTVPRVLEKSRLSNASYQRYWGALLALFRRRERAKDRSVLERNRPNASMVFRMPCKW